MKSDIARPNPLICFETSPCLLPSFDENNQRTDIPISENEVFILDI